MAGRTGGATPPQDKWMPKTRPAMARFQEKVRIDPDGCHRWIGCITAKGYGKFRVGSTADGSRRTVQAHRWHWEQVKGPIPDGLEPDHLCRHRECVRLEHLEPVTKSVNRRRGWSMPQRAYCSKGHAMSGHNVIVRKDGKRNCRTCKNAAVSLWKKNKRKSAKLES